MECADNEAFKGVALIESVCTLTAKPFTSECFRANLKEYATTELKAAGHETPVCAANRLEL